MNKKRWVSVIDKSVVVHVEYSFSCGRRGWGAAAVVRRKGAEFLHWCKTVSVPLWEL